MVDKVLGLSIVVGSVIASGFRRSFSSATQRVEVLGKTVKETNKKLKAVDGVIKYKRQLEELKEKRKKTEKSSARLDAGIAALTKRYKEAKRTAKSYGINIGDAVKEHQALGKSAEKARNKLDRLTVGLTPFFQLNLDGQDITDSISSRVVSITIDDYAGVESDVLEIILDDTDSVN